MRRESAWIERGCVLELLGLLLAALLVLFAVRAKARAGGTDLVLSVATDHHAYGSDQPVEITVSKCNPTPGEITVTHNSSAFFAMEVLGSEGAAVARWPGGGPLVVFDVTWQPGECRLETFTWTQNAGFIGFEGPADPDAEPGRYFVRYDWFPGPFTLAAESPGFLIGVRPIPTLSPLAACTLAVLVSAASLWLLKPGHRRRSP